MGLAAAKSSVRQVEPTKMLCDSNTSGFFLYYLVVVPVPKTLQ